MAFHDPLKMELKILALREEVHAAAVALHDRIGDYSEDGVAKEWERRAAPFRARLETLTQETALAMRDLERVEKYALESAIPPAAPTTDAKDELKFSRVVARLKGDKLADIMTATDVLKDSLGTSFARLWADEMTARGVFRKDGETRNHAPTLEGVLREIHPPYAHAVNFVQYGKTVMNFCIANRLEEVEKTLKVTTVHNPDSAPARGVAGQRLSEYNRVDRTVTSPFAWAIGGSRFKCADVLDVRTADKLGRALEIQEVTLWNGERSVVKVDGVTLEGANSYEIREGDPLKVRLAKLLAEYAAKGNEQDAEQAKKEHTNRV